MKPLHFALLGACAVLALAAPAHAAWLPSGLAMCGTSTWEYPEPSIVPDGAGGCFVVATYTGHVGWVRHLTAAGIDNPTWPAGGVPLSASGFGTHAPRLARDGAGGVYVAYLNTECNISCPAYGPGRVIVQHLDATGARVAGWPYEGVPVVSTLDGYHGFTSSLPMLAGYPGGVLVAWLWNDGATQRTRLMVQRLNADGTQAWSGAPDGLDVAPSTDGSHATPAFAPDAMGGAWIAWSGLPVGATTPQVFVQHVLANGTLADAHGIPLEIGMHPQVLPRVLGDPQGGLTVAWLDSTVAGTYALRAQRLGPGAAPLWGAGVGVQSGIVGANVAPLLVPSGQGAYVAWVDGRHGVPHTYLTRLGKDGLVVAPWPANGLLANDDLAPAKALCGAPDGAGGLYLGWVGTTFEALHRNADGSLADGWASEGVAMCHDGPEQCAPPWDLRFVELVPDGAGGAFGTWEEIRVVAGGDPQGWVRSYVQSLATDGPVSALASLVSTSVAEGHVRLTWWTAASGALRVERATGGADAGWEALVSVTPDADGHVVIDDADVRPGMRYGYRLVRTSGGVDVTLDEEWVSVPRLGELRVDGARPNPARGAFALGFTTPIAAPVSIELLDAAGRRAWSARLDGLSPGSHEIGLEGSAKLPAGIYLVRLVQGTRVATGRVCVVR